MFSNEALHCRAIDIRNRLRLYPAVAIGHANNSGLADRATALTQFLAGVFVLLFAADKGFVNLNVRPHIAIALAAHPCFADTLRRKDVDDLYEDARAIVRKSPVVAIGVAAAVGFALVRLVKSGVEQPPEDEARDATDSTNGAGI